jgi:hypothetical protein
MPTFLTSSWLMLTVQFTRNHFHGLFKRAGGGISQVRKVGMPPLLDRGRRIPCELAQPKMIDNAID